MAGLDKEDSHLIAFVYKAFAVQAIDAADVRRWADSIFARGETYPHYLLELSWFDGRLGDLDEAIGFSPVWPDNWGDSETLEAFAFRRGIIPFETHRTRGEAEELLRSNPQVVSVFLETFPWLSHLVGAPADSP